MALFSRLVFQSTWSSLAGIRLKLWLFVLFQGAFEIRIGAICTRFITSRSLELLALAPCLRWICPSRGLSTHISFEFTHLKYYLFNVLLKVFSTKTRKIDSKKLARLTDIDFTACFMLASSLLAPRHSGRSSPKYPWIPLDSDSSSTPPDALGKT